MMLEGCKVSGTKGMNSSSQSLLINGIVVVDTKTAAGAFTNNFAGDTRNANDQPFGETEPKKRATTYTFHSHYKRKLQLTISLFFFF